MDAFGAYYFINPELSLGQYSALVTVLNPFIYLKTCDKAMRNKSRNAIIFFFVFN